MKIYGYASCECVSPSFSRPMQYTRSSPDGERPSICKWGFRYTMRLSRIEPFDMNNVPFPDEWPSRNVQQNNSHALTELHRRTPALLRYVFPAAAIFVNHSGSSIRSLFPFRLVLSGRPLVETTFHFASAIPSDLPRKVSPGILRHRNLAILAFTKENVDSPLTAEQKNKYEYYNGYAKHWSSNRTSYHWLTSHYSR